MLNAHNKRNDLKVLCGPVAVVLFILNVIVAGSTKTGYSHISQTVSELGSPGSPAAFYYNTAILIFGVLFILFSAGVHQVLKTEVGSKTGIAGLYTIGVMNVIGGVFPLNSGEMAGASTIIHTTSGLIMLFSFIISIPLLNRSIKNRVQPLWIRRPLTLCWIAGIFGIFMMTFLQSLAVQGLGQRIFYLSFFVWIVLFGRSISNLNKEKQRVDGS